MQLFELENYQVIFLPQTMMIKEFSKVRDKYKDNNEMILKEMSYIWFFCDVRSDYKNILNEDERKEEIKSAIALPSDWEPDDITLNAIDYYVEYSKTPSSGLYDASMKAAHFIEKKLKDPESLLTEEDNKGGRIYKLDSIVSMLKNIPDVMSKLHKARETVIKELESKAETVGSKTPSIFEDGI